MDMPTQRVASLIYRFINFVTERFPAYGARSIDRAILAVAGNPLAAKATLVRDVCRLRRIGRLGSICVLADMNIGDAIIIQGAIAGLRDFLPDARIDYVMSERTKDLVTGNPQISNVYAVYTGAPYPNEHDLGAINEILKRSRYDLVLNFCPFARRSIIAFPRERTIGYTGLAAAVASAEKDPRAVSHLSYQLHRYIHSLFSHLKKPVSSEEFRGGSVTLSAEAIAAAERFLQTHGLAGIRRPKLFFNTDTSSPFTMIPLRKQTSLLLRLTELPCDILLGAGYRERGSEEQLLAALPPHKRAKITVVPATTPLDVYAALIDHCDVFITGDTGPLHIAAARKRAREGNHRFRNRTAVLSVFGATPPRLYGYDSSSPGFFAANQDAPSRTYVPPSSARNLTYIVKEHIAADEEDFFKNLDLNGIISSVRDTINSQPATPEVLGDSRKQKTGSR
jgi:ADP-heptose:LPS heptosyltransferase